MNSDLDYSVILKGYPELISKEQMCKLFHLSKRAAKYYLDEHIIPCVDTGKATHRYLIKTVDAVEFMRKRSECFELYIIHNDSASKQKTPTKVSEGSAAFIKRYLKIVTEITNSYPDLMTVPAIASLTGYSEKTIFKWVNEENLRTFHDGNKIFLSKKQLVDFMMGERFRGIKCKSSVHRRIVAAVIASMG